MNVIKALPDMCRCSEALLVSSIGIVSRVQSCPVCVGKALEWFGYQYELFPKRGESVSVSALSRSTSYAQSANMVEAVEDGLPF